MMQMSVLFSLQVNSQGTDVIRPNKGRVGRHRLVPDPFTGSEMTRPRPLHRKWTAFGVKTFFINCLY